MFWLFRCAWLALVLLLQTVIVADLLHSLEENPSLDVAYLFIFGVTLLYLAIAGIILLYNWYAFFALAVANRAQSTAAARDRVEIEESEEYGEQRVLFGNLLVDTTLYVLLTVFVSLAVDHLERLNDGDEARPMRSWFSIFVWLFAFFVVLFVALLAAAVHTCGEERLQKADLNGGEWFSAAFNGVIVGVAIDRAELAGGRARRADKADYYLADANYHALPTSYLCTPTLTPNYFDFILNWLILLLVVYLGIASLLVGVYLYDRRRFDLASLLVGWWVLETLIFFAALGDLLAMGWIRATTAGRRCRGSALRRSTRSRSSCWPPRCSSARSAFCSSRRSTRRATSTGGSCSRRSSRSSPARSSSRHATRRRRRRW